MTNLFEQYKERLAISEKVHAKTHMNEGMSQNKKLVVAQTLKNISEYINEAFANSTGTQRSDLGNFKRFALNITTVAVPC